MDVKAMAKAAVYLVELEPGLYLGEKSSHAKAIYFAKRYKLTGAKLALIYARKIKSWPNARIVDALAAIRTEA